MRSYSPEARQRLKELVGQAYERELAALLAALGARFDALRAGTLGAAALHHEVQHYLAGPSRHLWSKYYQQDPDMVVAQAVAGGWLEPTGVPAEVLARITPDIDFFREQIEEERREAATR